ncbi:MULTISPECIES: (2Fe-2S)-binding protein [Actinoalloteichus]|uniref:2Fe-2S iron-sulfur cluster binding domain n=1 Tax=Actinoalloteichus fjordicus TaxID=1612552 RepID=A0AAC9LFL7_9PSEU|nr:MULTISPECIES: (2Fe-2S)-binding protein [Actinoalloteichus]APU15430.1 2Fe-2S iron-sulfur cluster binding domain [Actinoalloteichus fjordicus]
MVPSSVDVVGRADEVDIVIEVDGEPVPGVRGQTLAGVLLAAGRDSWRTTSRSRRPRGVFCGIGVCFDCVVTVNGERDVRACQRRACHGDTVTLQADELPGAGS